MTAYSGRLADRVAIVTGAGRGITPSSDVAGAVAFPASDEAGWIAGRTTVCDGGVSLTGRAG